jgi:hypothetical protein
VKLQAVQRTAVLRGKIFFLDSHIRISRFFISLILGVVLLSSCVNNSGGRAYELPKVPEETRSPRTFTIIDYKNKAAGEAIPEWVSLYLNSGLREVEALRTYQGSYVFIHRNEGNNFNALQLWKDNFSVELDFPRLAAARIEARFSASVPYPDDEYGAFYEALIRAASDASWTGATTEDDFWIRKRYPASETEGEQENWEFLVLVTMEKSRFSSQLESIFENIKPIPPPDQYQIAAINRVKERFFERF